jgi:hypothetical protein
LKHATEYYAELCGPEQIHDIHIDHGVWDELEHVSDEENHNLCKSFSEKEVMDALFQMEKNKAAGPDKIPIELYQICSPSVKHDIMHLFDDFHSEKVDTSRLNYGIITLLPKVNDAAKNSTV